MAGERPMAGQKRKLANTSRPSAANTRKRQKFQDARDIPAQSADAALSKTGELNIASFIKAREHEINALDKSMKRARQTLSTRAFQQVPRHLRRRTASHNAKKVPRRLQRRAKREMIEDNTPTVNSKTGRPTSRMRLRLETAKALKKLNQKRKTVRQKKREANANAAESDPSKHVDTVRIPRIKKDQLAKPPLATSKFKRRQVSKTWLPTHLWHTKRAHLTLPTEPLWRIAIPLRPTEKGYRATHRTSESRGCIAWDMSYMSTIACRGTETALEGLLKALNFHGNGWSGQSCKKWKSGSRFASGWICMNETKEAVGVADVFWCAKSRGDDAIAENVESGKIAAETDTNAKSKQRKTKLDRKIMVRVHPSAFQQVWLEILLVAKLQKPQVLVEDLRFEIGSIELMGPGSAETLGSTLKISHGDVDVRETWEAMLSLNSPALLPVNTMMNFQVHDPRLHPQDEMTGSSNISNQEDCLRTITEWPLDAATEPSLLFSHKARFSATKLASQWTLNRRRKAVMPGQPLESSSSDPSIPIMLLAHRSVGQTITQQGKWTLLAPWKCIDVIWRRLLYCHLSSGSKPRFGGLCQVQQVAFEQSAPWFPGDFPGTSAGKVWENSQAEKRFDDWIRRPPSRRKAWQGTDLGLGRKGELGRGWTCDWEYLFEDAHAVTNNRRPVPTTTTTRDVSTNPQSQLPLTQRQRKAARAKAAEMNEADRQKRRNTSSAEPDEVAERKASHEVEYTQLMPNQAKLAIQQRCIPKHHLKPALVTIRIKLLTKGTPDPAARIYRLPSKEHRSSTSVDKPMSFEKTSTPSVSTSETTSNSRTCHVSGPMQADLREQWLILENAIANTPRHKIKKGSLNHRGLPSKSQHHSLESLRHINVIPKNAPAEIYEQYGPKPLSEKEKNVLIKQELDIRMEEEKVWEMHIPCPDSKDLMGFVTSGGYNLAEGRGTAIGAIWLQRLLDGWADELRAPIPDASNQGVRMSKDVKHNKEKDARRRDKERYLCIVRNPGESIGRLARWELCE